MEAKPQLIKGGKQTDARGTVCFVNEFDMSEVKRFYCIKHPDTSVIRAWRGHQIEQRWFYVAKGTFEIKLVEIDDWKNPDCNLEQLIFVLKAEDNTVLQIPKGYATSLQALNENSELMVFADFGLDHAKNDDYLFPPDYFRA